MGNINIPDDPLISEPIEYIDEDDNKSSWRKAFWEIIETLLLAVLMFFVINAVTARIRVDGRSMEPSFYHGDYVLVNRMTYRFGDIVRGDVVVFPFPNNPEEDFIKRVIGLPGDQVEILNGMVLVNGFPLEESYIKEPPRRNESLITVPVEMVFVIGDNRNDSSDSRRWGPVRIDSIIGKAVLRYWPINTFGLVEHPVLNLP